jgi:hypothetical protein
LAPDEYSSVQQACLTIGARSISDFARQTLLSCVECGDASLEGDLVTIARRLKEVESALEVARALIARVLGTESSKNGAQLTTVTAIGASAGHDGPPDLRDGGQRLTRFER